MFLSAADQSRRRVFQINFDHHECMSKEERRNNNTVSLRIIIIVEGNGMSTLRK